MPMRLLAAEGHDLSIFFANSNITPADEYQRRLGELHAFAQTQGVSVTEGAYDPAAWEHAVAPAGEARKAHSPALGAQAEFHTLDELLDDEHRRERCRLCYRLRLEEAAQWAQDQGFEGLASTLAVSPYQFNDILDEELERACAPLGLRPVKRDFRPYYQEATRISRERGMYRQNYCGCRFSVAEGKATRDFIRAQKAAKREAQKGRRRAQEAAQAARRAERQAYAEKQAKKRAIRNALRQK